MILILILAILLIGLMAILAQGVVGLYSSSNHLEQIQHEQRLVTLWSDMVQRSFIKAGPNGEYLAPVGRPLYGASGQLVGHGLPSSMWGPSKNSMGIDVRYCALGHEPALVANATISLLPGVNYHIESLGINGVDYVYRGDDIPGLNRASPNLIAFVLSPQESDNSISCANIQFDIQTGRYFVAGKDVNVIPVMAPNVFTP